MHVAVVTPPVPYVTVAQAKEHLQVETNAFDDLIGTYVAAAIEHLDGPEGYLRRALGTQVLRATVYEFPACRENGLLLPYPPVQDINDVEYVEPGGATVHVDPDAYELTPEGRFRLAYGASWPARRSWSDPITIQFTAGWLAAPKRAVTAVLMHVGSMFDKRDETAEFPDAARRLVSPLRIPRL